MFVKGKKVTYQCAGCGARKELKEQPGKQPTAPVCCGQPMKEAPKK